MWQPAGCWKNIVRHFINRWKWSNFIVCIFKLEYFKNLTWYDIFVARFVISASKSIRNNFVYFKAKIDQCYLSGAIIRAWRPFFWVGSNRSHRGYRINSVIENLKLSIEYRIESVIEHREDWISYWFSYRLF